MKFYRSLIFVIVFLSGCSLISSGSSDPFYKGAGDISYGRFPLIKPYEAGHVTTWSIALHTAQTNIHYSSIWEISDIAVEGNVIMVYAPSMAKLDELRLSWFVIIPDPVDEEKSIEIGFADESEFLGYVQEYGIEIPAWEDPTDIFQRFDRTGCLEWIPDCK